MIYIKEMREKFDEIFQWYIESGGRTPTAPEECFQLYRWLFVIGLSLQHVYAHSQVKDSHRTYKIVELGTGLGITSILMAKGFQDGNKHCLLKGQASISTVDNGKGADVKETSRLIRLANAKFQLGIEFIHGNDLDFLETMPEESIDFLFIDAEHGYKDVFGALNSGITRVVPKGRLTGHDYDFNDIGVPMAIDEWREINKKSVFGWSTFDSLWWMIKR